MFRANLIGLISTVTAHDIHGRSVFSDPMPCPFAVVHLQKGSQKTSVRADSSASRGSADEIVTIHAKILIPSSMTPKISDHFTFSGKSYRIVSVEDRFSVQGRLDHYECDMQILP